MRAGWLIGGVWVGPNAVAEGVVQTGGGGSGLLASTDVAEGGAMGICWDEAERL